MMIITQKEKEMLRFIMTNKKFQVMVKELFITMYLLHILILVFQKKSN